MLNSLKQHEGQLSADVDEHLVVYGTGRVQEGGGAKLLQELAHVYFGDDRRFPDTDTPPDGYVLRITPTRVTAKVDVAKKGLKDGTFAIWKGPIADQAGKEVLKAGVTADDKFLHGINFYVKGVKGKPPKS